MTLGSIFCLLVGICGFISSSKGLKCYNTMKVSVLADTPVNTKVEQECPDPSSCFYVSAETETRIFGFTANGSMVVANCAPSNSCSELSCDQFKTTGSLGSLSQQMTIKNCEIRCCDTPLCNDANGAIHEVTTAPTTDEGGSGAAGTPSVDAETLATALRGVTTTAEAIAARFTTGPQWEGSGTMAPEEWCGESNLTAEVGRSKTFTSPGWPGKYADSDFCEWYMEAPPGHVVSFFVESFETESCCDLLRIYDGDDRQPYEVVSGSRPRGASLTSRSNRIRATFTSDSTFAYDGFSIRYTAIPAEPTTTSTTPTTAAAQTCGYNATASSTPQTLTSPGYPQEYPSGSDCYWLIRAAPGKQVNFTVTSLNVESCCDFLRVYDGVTTSGSGTLAQNYAITSFVSSYGALLVHFSSDLSVERRGFSATYYEITTPPPPVTTSTTSYCGLTQLSATPGVNVVLTSPNYPNSYPNGADCIWVIIAPLGMRVSIKYDYFATEGCCDRVSYFNTLNTSEVPVRVDAGLQTPVPYTSSTEALILKFTSDLSVPKVGFSLTYTAVDAPAPTTDNATLCDDTEVVVRPGKNVTIQTPNYPNNYGSRLDCWLVATTNAGMNLKLTFDYFESEECCDVLNMYDSNVAGIGNSRIGQVKGKLDRTDNVRYSWSNRLALQFTSDGSVNYRGFSGVLSAVPVDEVPRNTTEPQENLVDSVDSVSEMLPRGDFNCSSFQRVKVEGAIRYYALEVSACPTNSCIFMRADANVDGEMGFVEVGGCLSMDECRNLTCEFISQQILESEIGLAVTNCNVTCCNENMCNDPHRQAPTSGTQLPTMTPATNVMQTSGCGGNINLVVGNDETFTSPYYPGNYPSDSNCTWEIRAPQGYVIQLIFNDFYTESCCDKLNVYSGTGTTQQFAGSNYQTVYSDGNYIRLIFTSDGSVVNRGFSITASAQSRPVFETTTPYIPDIIVNETRVATGDGLRCWSIQKVATNGTNIINQRGVTDCFEGSCALLTANATMPLGISGSFAMGMCSPSALCQNANCSSFMSALGIASFWGVSLENCSISCCDTDLCNDVTNRTSQPETTTVGMPLETSAITENAAGSCGPTQLSALPGVDGILTSPNYPQNYPNLFECTWVITAPPGMRVSITYDHFDTEECCDKVSYFNTLDSGETPIETKSGTLIPIPYTSNTNTLVLKFLSDSSVSSTGFSLIYTAIDASAQATQKVTLCEDTKVSVAAGEKVAIESPNYPNNYGNSLNCWLVANTTSGMRLKLEFDYFQTETCCDVLTMYDSRVARATSPYREIKGTLSKGNTVYFSWTNSLALRFSADGSVNYRGFNGVLSAVPADEMPRNATQPTTTGTQTATTAPADTTTSINGCGDNINLVVGNDETFTSPYYPGNYPSDSNCTWEIRAPPGYVIQLTFNDFYTESCCDKLNVYSGTGTTQQFAGSNYQTVYSDGNYIRLIFTSDGSVVERGFSITASAQLRPVFETTTPYFPDIIVNETRVVTGGGLRCWSIQKVATNGTNIINQRGVSDCFEGSCALLTANATMAIGIPVPASFAMGMCVPSASCEEASCSSFLSTLGIASSLGLNLDNCTISCCDTDLCNDVTNETSVTEATLPTEEFVTETTVPTGGVSRCWSIQKVDSSNGEIVNQRAITDCSEGSCLLLTANVTMSVGIPVSTTMTMGMCIPTASCQESTCSSFISALGIAPVMGLGIDSCNATCCDTDLCNDVPQATTDSNAGNNVESSGDESAGQCWDIKKGVAMGEDVLNQREVVDCLTGSCLLMNFDATLSVGLGTGVPAEFKIGMCVPKSSCLLPTCSSVTSLLGSISAFGLNIGDCTASCCNTPLCNDVTDQNFTMSMTTPLQTRPDISVLGTQPSPIENDVCNSTNLSVFPGGQLTITSSNYPSNYPVSTDCWTVIRTNPGFILKLDFQYFNTESCCDIFYMYDTDGVRTARNLMEEISGDRVTEGLPALSKYSRNNFITIRFKSDSSITRQGFSIAISSVVPNATVQVETTSVAMTTLRPTSLSVCQNEDVNILPGNSLSLNSPNYPNNYPNSLTCWTILRTSPGHILQLEFLHFNTESCCDVLYMLDSDQRRMNARLVIDELKGTQVTSSSTSVIKLSRRNYVALRFRSDNSVTAKGFSIEVSSVPTNTTSQPETTNYATQQPTVSATTEAVSGASDLQCWFIQRVNTSNGELVNQRGQTDCFNGSCLLLTANTTISIGLPEGIKATFTMGMCVPTPACQESTCSSFISSLDIVKNFGLNMTSCTSTCCSTPLCNDVTQEGSSQPATRPVQVTTVPTVLDTTSHQTIVDVCQNRDLTVSPGEFVTITSPEYPNNYPNSKVCWTILRTAPGYVLKLDFQYFYSEGCCDILYMYDSDRRMILPRKVVDEVKGPRLTDNSSALIIFSRRNMLAIRFRSDHSVTYKGFSAVLSAVLGNVSIEQETTTTSLTTAHTKTMSVCGPRSQFSIYPNAEETLVSPGYPSSYPSSLNCYLLLMAPPGYKIQLNFTDFTTEECCDQLRILDGNIITTDLPLIAQLKGSSYPRTVQSITNTVVLNFISDVSLNFRGFTALVTAIATSSPTNYTGGPEPDVTTPQQTSTESTTESLVTVPAPDVQACDATTQATISEKIIASPSWPQYYPHNLHCRWTINGSEGYMIQFNFTSFSTESCCDYLSVNKEMNGGLAQLRSLRGSLTLGVPIVFDARRLHLIFHSDESYSRQGFYGYFKLVPKPINNITKALESCGDEAQAEITRKIFTSPGWPDTYASNLDCRWTIVGRPNYAVRFNFSSFATESCCDYLSISVQGQEIQRLAGWKANRVVDVDAERIQLLFHTDRAVGRDGFEIIFFLVPGTQRTFAATQASTNAETQAETTTSTIATTQAELTTAQASLSVCSQSEVAINPKEGKTVTSPNYPWSYRSYSECQILLTAPSGYRIRLNFTDFKTEGCCDKLKILDRQRSANRETLIAELKGSIRPRIVYSRSNSILLRFKSDGSVNYRGFTAQVTAVPVTNETRSSQAECGFNTDASLEPLALRTPGYPIRYPHNLRCEWTLRAPRGYQVMLSVYLGEVAGCCDFMEVFDGYSNTSKKLGTIDGYVWGERNFTSTSRHLFVTFTTDAYDNSVGYAATYALVPDTTTRQQTSTETTSTVAGTGTCGGTYVVSNVTQYLQSQNYPNPYNPNSLCNYNFQSPDGSIMQIEVVEFETENCCDKLFFFENNEQTDVWHGSVQTGSKYLSRSSQVTLRFTSDLGSQYRGFRLSYKTADSVPTTPPPPDVQACGTTTQATSSEKIIASPSWPQNYPHQQNCRWTINGTEGYLIQLNFTSFNTESCCDYLTISGALGQLRSLRGDLSLDVPMVFDERYLNLFFHSDGSINRQGFYGYFKLVPKTSNGTKSLESCGDEAQAEITPKIFTSPGWPNNYASNLNCRWTIVGRPNYVVHFNFSTFSTESCCDYLSISVQGQEVQRLAGLQDSRVVDIDAVRIQLLFRSDASVTRAGFEATFYLVEKAQTTTSIATTEAVQTTTTQGTTQSVATGVLPCDFRGYIGDIPVTINSPNYPSNYPVNTKCSWTLLAQEGQEIEFNLANLEVETCCDFVELLDGSQQRLIANISTKPEGVQTYKSTTNTLVVNFYSDKSVTAPGFTAAAHAVKAGNLSRNTCGFTSEATEDWQWLYSPQYPENYPNRAKCEWIIGSPPGNSQIVLQVTELSIEICCDTLQIFDENVTNPHVVSVKSPLTFESAARMVKLRFESDNTIANQGFTIRYRIVFRGFTTTPEIQTIQPTTVTVDTATTAGARQTTTSTSGTETNGNDDIEFLPGCSFREYYQKTWLCSTLLFNDYPYAEISQCRTNMNYYNHCLQEAVLRCSTGTKPTISFGFGPVAISAESLTASLINSTNILSPTYDMFCASDLRYLNEITANVTEAMQGIQMMPPTICNTNKFMRDLQDLMAELPNVVGAKSSIEFCRSYGSMVNIMARMYEGFCNFDRLRYMSTMLGTFYSKLQKIFDLIPKLIRESSELPKCLALASMERSPVIPSISTPVTFETTDSMGCSSYNMDLIFLMDGSMSISSPNFLLMVNFIKSIVGTMDITNNYVGVIQYSHFYNHRPINQQRYITTEISLGEFNSHSEFNAAMNKIQHHQYTTYTAAAIRKAIQVDLQTSGRFNNPCTKKVIFVITDGIASDGNMLESVVAAANNVGVTFFAVGVGSNVVQSEMEVISGGVRDHTFLVSDFQTLQQQVPVIRDALHNILSDGTYGSGSAP